MLQINSLNVIGSKWSCLRAKVCSTSGQSHSAVWAFALPLRDSREEIRFAQKHKIQQLICFPHLRAENWKKVSASEFCDDDVDELRFQTFFQRARHKSSSGLKMALWGQSGEAIMTSQRLERLTCGGVARGHVPALPQPRSLAQQSERIWNLLQGTLLSLLQGPLIKSKHEANASGGEGGRGVGVGSVVRTHAQHSSAPHHHHNHLQPHGLDRVMSSPERSHDFTATEPSLTHHHYCLLF